MLVSMGTGVALQGSAAPKEMFSIVRDETSGILRVRINFSSLSMMQECWRKVEYSLIRGLRSNLESPATLFGTAIHKGLEEYYSSPRLERNLPKNYEDIMKMIGVGRWEESWSGETVFRAARAFVLKAAPLEALPADNKRSVIVGVWILQHYFERYLGDPFVIMSDAAGPIVERRFTMPLGEFAFGSEIISIDIFGQIDCVLRNEQSGAILPTDHKTTSQLGPQFYQRLHPNFQYTCYSLAAREVLGLDTNSFLVNALQVKDIPKTSRGSGPQFARQATDRTEEDYVEFKRAIVDSVIRYLTLQHNGHFPMSAPGSCSNYGGCQYLDVCAAPASLRDTVISAKYSEVGT